MSASLFHPIPYTTERWRLGRDRSEGGKPQVSTLDIITEKSQVRVRGVAVEMGAEVQLLLEREGDGFVRRRCCLLADCRASALTSPVRNCTILTASAAYMTVHKECASINAASSLRGWKDLNVLISSTTRLLYTYSSRTRDRTSLVPVSSDCCGKRRS